MPSSVTVTVVSSITPRLTSDGVTSRVGKLGSMTFTVNVLSSSAFSACTVTVANPAESPVISPCSTLAIAFSSTV